MWWRSCLRYITTNTGVPMATGLPPDLSDFNQEWVIDFSRFRQAWTQTPRPTGKAKGEGICLAHPDSGWTAHPELTPSRYLTAESKNLRRVKMLKGGVIVPTGAWGVPADSAEDLLLGKFPGHGTATASVLMSGIGHPDGSAT